MVEESLLRKLMTSIKCGACGQCYAVDNIAILSHQEDLWLLRASCSACHTQCLVAAVVKENKVREVITDLTRTELDKFRNRGKVTADDVLDMYTFLKGFDGDFPRLFSQQQT